MNEEELVKSAQAGEAKSFGKLYDTYIKPIYRFIFLRVGRKADAEDIAHHVFLNAWQSIQTYQFKGFPFSSWLYRIAHNAIIDFYRTAKPEVSIDTVAENVLHDTGSVDETVDRAIAVGEVQAALTRLGADEQAVITMRFIDDLSNREIALAIQKTEGAVRVIQHRALKKLKTLVYRPPA
jgi:RNA polymerase sigma-70 factor (ECF subfamily)